jgi:hypothetical protein
MAGASYEIASRQIFSPSTGSMVKIVCVMLFFVIKQVKLLLHEDLINFSFVFKAIFHIILIINNILTRN